MRPITLYNGVSGKGCWQGSVHRSRSGTERWTDWEDMVDSGDLLTVADAAVFLDRSTEQVRRYLREGRLNGRRMGGQWFIDQGALRAFSHSMKAEQGFLARIPLAMESDPLGKIIGIGSGGGTNLSEGKEAYRRVFRWRR